MWWRSVILSALLFGTIAWLIPQVLWVLAWLGAKAFSLRLPYTPFFWVGTTLVFVVWGALTYGHFVGRFKMEVKNVDFLSPDVPTAFDGYRIAHISDLHVDSFNDSPQALQRIVDTILAQNPDIILFTGDMATGSFDAIQNHKEVLQKLASKCQVISVLGNHDFFIYSKQFTSAKQRLEAADRLTQYERRTLHWTVLRNEHILLNRNSDTIAIAGIDNSNGNDGFHTINHGDLSKATNGIKDRFTILLSHDPSFWSAEVLPHSQVQVTLSGHTHAAQARLFGWSFAHLLFHQCDGRYDITAPPISPRMLYVNAGIGCTAPFRIACPAEITILTLRKGLLGVANQ